jgi:hypothetical protein
MPADSNAQVQASVTKTATFSSAAFDLGAAQFGNFHPLFARFKYSAATNASGSNSVVFSIDTCATSGGTYVVGGAGTAAAIALSTTAQAGEIYIALAGIPEFIEATATFSGAGSTPTITYQVDLVPSKP